MSDLIRLFAGIFPSSAAWTLCLCLIAFGWYAHGTFWRITNLEKYQKSHELQYQQGLDRLEEMHEAVMKLTALSERQDLRLNGHDFEISRLRDWRDKFERK